MQKDCTMKQIEFGREQYLKTLIERKHNGLVKIITGIRRCGKSYLLSTLFKRHLLKEGVREDHIVEMSEGIIEGDEIRILKGPLRDQDAIIKKIDRHKRVAYVQMFILGRETSVKLGLEIVRKV